VDVAATVTIPDGGDGNDALLVLAAWRACLSAHSTRDVLPQPLKPLKTLPFSGAFDLESGRILRCQHMANTEARW